MRPSLRASLAKHRKYHRYAASTIDRPLGSHRVSFHHGGHHHTTFIDDDNNNPSNISNCDIKKFLIYAILFFLGYYLLFVAITTTYRHNVYSKNIRNPEVPNRVELTNNININAYKISLNQIYSNKNDSSSTNTISIKQNTAQRTINKKANKQPMDGIGQRRKRSRRKRHRQEVRKLKPFPQMYISDNPYYLTDNLVVMGQVADAEKRIDLILYQLESIACLFNSTTFILFESNSKDKTLVHLERWSVRKPLNCTQIAYKPENKQKYHSIKTLDQLIQIFDENDSDNNEDENYKLIDEYIVNFLKLNYAKIEDVDVYALSKYLHGKLQRAQLKPIEIEQILYDKLVPIKYAKYHSKIDKHQTHIFKTVISGDEVVEKELAEEKEILRQLKVYGSLNELHTPLKEWGAEKEEVRSNEDDDEDGIDESGEINAIFMEENGNEMDLQYNFLQGIKQQELRKHSHSDFVEEFGDIHDEIEKSIQYDEAIIHEKLRERKRKYEQRRKKEREKRSGQQPTGNTNNNNGNGQMNGNKPGKQMVVDENMSFRNELFRIERFVIYRNNLLQTAKELGKQLNIAFDYIMIADLDIYSVDVRTFMNELYHVDENVDGICIDGMDWMGYTRDTFATVKPNGGWLHYGHDSLVNNTAYIYNNDHAMYKRTKFPNHEKNRYESVKSCFGGIAIYKNAQNNLLRQKCQYTLTRDIFFTNYQNDGQIEENKGESVLNFNYTYDWWLEHRHHNEYSEESKTEMKLFIKQYIETLQVLDKTLNNKALIPKDGDICEHIPFHYCLWDKGFKFAISNRAKLYYDKFYPLQRNDTNWAYYLENRPKFTQ